MKIAEVIGKVTLSRAEESVDRAVWKIVVPLSAAGIQGDPEGRAEPLVAYDELGTNTGSLVALSEGGEASAPFHPGQKPLDAYIAAILDHIDLDPNFI